MNPTWMIYEGNALARLAELPDNSIHMAVGSPPYWGGLRTYLGNTEQLGHEPHPRIYARRLADICDVVMAKLRPEGTLWLNLGDSYYGSGGAGGDYNPGGMKESQPKFPGSRRTVGRFEFSDIALRLADLTTSCSSDEIEAMLLDAGWSPPAKLKLTDQAAAPWETALELRQRGWYLRCDVIWHKRNPRPGGGHLKRPSIDHEYVFQLTKSAKTYYDSFAVRERSKAADAPPDEYRNRRSVWSVRARSRRRQRRATSSVWKTGVSSYKGAHFATFPSELIEPMIRASTSEVGVCRLCGAPFTRIEERLAPSTFTELKSQGHFSTETLKRLAGHGGKREDKNAVTQRGTTPHLAGRKAITVGWAAGCKCCAYPPAPAIVLDPFAGAGTAGLAALKMGRSFVGVELEAGYVETIAKRLTEGFPEAVGAVKGLT